MWAYFRFYGRLLLELPQVFRNSVEAVLFWLLNGQHF